MPKAAPWGEVQALPEALGSTHQRRHAGLATWDDGDAMHDEIGPMADMMSCKAVIKAGQRLSPGKMSRLLERRFECECPLTCPHGRPILLGNGEAAVRRRFLRFG